MKFKKEELQALAYDDYDTSEGWEVMRRQIIDTTRWSTVYQIIFRKDDKFYGTVYAEAATEAQEERPYEDEGDLIGVTEMEQYQEMVTDYREIQ